MTDRPPPRKPPPVPGQNPTPPAPRGRAPSLESFRPLSERTGSPLQQLQPPSGQPQRPRPPVGRQAPQSAGHRHRETEPEGRSTLARIFIGAVLGVVGLVAAAAVALTIWAPVDLVRDQLVSRIKARTGRDLVIAGPAALSFYPNLAITMADVSLSAPPGMGSEPTLKMQTLEASVPLLPLLQKEVRIERLVLGRPVIDLHVDARGRRSWDFAQAPEPLRYAQAGAKNAMPKELQDFVKAANPDSREVVSTRGALGALEALSLEDVRIADGTVRYSDERSGFSAEVQKLDAQVRLAGIASPLEAKGSLVWRAEPLTFDVKLASPKLVGEERPARLTLKVSGRPIDLDYDGSILVGRVPEAEGTISARTTSLGALMALVGARPAAGTPGGAIGIAGRLKASETAISLSDGAATFDQLKAQGTITVEPRPGRPMIRGNLQIAELDLNRLLQPGPSAAAPAAIRPAVPARAAPATPAKEAPRSIEDLLNDGPAKPGPRVQGYTRRQGWSDEPIDLSALGLADADLKLAIGSLIYREIKVGQTQLRLALKHRTLTANFDDLHLYEGRGRGLLTLNGATPTPVLGVNFNLDGTAALPLLKDAADFDWVSGRAKVNLALGGQGASERQIVASLNGRADVQFRDGAVVGYNVQQILANITQGRLAGLERSASAKTDFSEMAASFTIQNGIASNKDLRLTSPSLRVTGAGTANLPERTLDYLLRPRITAGPASAAEGTSLEVPLKVAGSWDKPTIAPDLDAVLKNPEQAVETVKQLGRQFKNANPETINKAKDLLNRFLKPQ